MAPLLEIYKVIQSIGVVRAVSDCKDSCNTARPSLGERLIGRVLNLMLTANFVSLFFRKYRLGQKLLLKIILWGQVGRLVIHFFALKPIFIALAHNIHSLCSQPRVLLAVLYIVPITTAGYR